MKAAMPLVMFVDDDEALIEGIKRSLHGMRNQWRMTFSSQPALALEAYRQEAASVVVSDIHMPDLDGLEMVSQMMDMDKLGRSRFMFLTGGGDFDAALRAINDLHIYRFLQKPIVRDSLVEAIEEALGDLEAVEAIGGQHAAAALELINAAVLVVDEACRLQFANPAGRRFLDKPGGVRLARDKICRASRPDETMELHDMVGACMEDANDRVRWLTVSADDWETQVSLVGIPRGEIGSDRSVVLLSTDAKAPEKLTSEALQSLFGLSPAESTITLAITRGERIDDAAEACGITVSSARTYLKRIFLKTGVSRQSDLVKLVLTSPALLVNSHQ